MEEIKREGRATWGGNLSSMNRDQLSTPTVKVDKHISLPLPTTPSPFPLGVQAQPRSVLALEVLLSRERYRVPVLLNVTFSPGLILFSFLIYLISFPLFLCVSIPTSLPIVRPS